MPLLDLTRWALIGFKDDTGLGRMSADFLAMMPEVKFLVIPSRRMAGAPLSDGEVSFDPEASDEKLRNALRPYQGVIFFQNPPHPALLRTAAMLGVPSVCVPMWEWFNAHDRELSNCSHFVCPNEFCHRTLAKLGFSNTTVVPWAVQTAALPRREIHGRARMFVHNAGLFEPDDRKGTRLTIEAFQNVRLPDIRLLVRVQNELNFEVRDPRIEVTQGNLRSHRELYAQGDVIIQASKAEGLGFGILEAMASGMPVITTDYPPMNESVPQSKMRVSTHWGKKSAEQATYISQAHFKIPRVSALARTIAWCAKNDLTRISAENRQWAAEKLNPERVRAQWIRTLETLLN